MFRRERETGVADLLMPVAPTGPEVDDEAFARAIEAGRRREAEAEAARARETAEVG